MSEQPLPDSTFLGHRHTLVRLRPSTSVESDFPSHASTSLLLLFNSSLW
jgi:hypothetical protein